MVTNRQLRLIDLLELSSDDVLSLVGNDLEGTTVLDGHVVHIDGDQLITFIGSGGDGNHSAGLAGSGINAHGTTDDLRIHSHGVNHGIGLLGFILFNGLGLGSAAALSLTGVGLDTLGICGGLLSDHALVPVVVIGINGDLFGLGLTAGLYLAGVGLLTLGNTGSLGGHLTLVPSVGSGGGSTDVAVAALAGEGGITVLSTSGISHFGSIGVNVCGRLVAVISNLNVVPVSHAGIAAVRSGGLMIEGDRTLLNGSTVHNTVAKQIGAGTVIQLGDHGAVSLADMDLHDIPGVGFELHLVAVGSGIAIQVEFLGLAGHLIGIAAGQGVDLGHLVQMDPHILAGEAQLVVARTIVGLGQNHVAIQTNLRQSALIIALEAGFDGVIVVKGLLGLQPEAAKSAILVGDGHLQHLLAVFLDDLHAIGAGVRSSNDVVVGIGTIIAAHFVSVEALIELSVLGPELGHDSGRIGQNEGVTLRNGLAVHIDGIEHVALVGSRGDGDLGVAVQLITGGHRSLTGRQGHGTTDAVVDGHSILHDGLKGGSNGDVIGRHDEGVVQSHVDLAVNVAGHGEGIDHVTIGGSHSQGDSLTFGEFGGLVRHNSTVGGLAHGHIIGGRHVGNHSDVVVVDVAGGSTGVEGEGARLKGCDRGLGPADQRAVVLGVGSDGELLCSGLDHVDLEVDPGAVLIGSSVARGILHDTIRAIALSILQRTIGGDTENKGLSVGAC